ncbi:MULTISPECIES: hypothetical protein [unclassified Hydrogenophaga]|uniref:hypothetical protein n=1 Tax=unclassified Hydrogenophaga TaxID=2610897 RepID=UPI000B181DDA|nr:MULTISPECIES: hypothetical protein [unclassified Hydrogenophaga]MBN9372593.1 hypothetical protein [Hydrogenophaga sp.]
MSSDSSMPAKPAERWPDASQRPTPATTPMSTATPKTTPTGSARPAAQAAAPDAAWAGMVEYASWWPHLH